MPIHKFIDEFFDTCDAPFLDRYQTELKNQIEQFFKERPHGRTEDWNQALLQLPQHITTHHIFNQSDVEIGTAAELGESLEPLLKTYMPWRKGPFNVFGTKIDTEWRSDWKWDRISPHISDLTDRSVLDIGCGNGYHLFRMLGDGAKLALGVDPTRLFLYQFHTLKHFLPLTPAHILPLRCEHLPAFNSFDTVFSLGVLYHRRSPIDHLTELLSFLRPDGELVLETLVVEGDEKTVLVPEDRYAKMANVWFLPSVAALTNWLARAGFKNIRCVDVNQTSIEEQRRTDWMTFHSLEDFLDPTDLNLTAEGLPAPRRATLIANR